MELRQTTFCVWFVVETTPPMAAAGLSHHRGGGVARQRALRRAAASGQGCWSSASLRFRSAGDSRSCATFVPTPHGGNSNVVTKAETVTRSANLLSHPFCPPPPQGSGFHATQHRDGSFPSSSKRAGISHDIAVVRQHWPWHPHTAFPWPPTALLAAVAHVLSRCCCCDH